MKLGLIQEQLCCIFCYSKESCLDAESFHLEKLYGIHLFLSAIALLTGEMCTQKVLHNTIQL